MYRTRYGYTTGVQPSVTARCRCCWATRDGHFQPAVNYAVGKLPPTAWPWAISTGQIGIATANFGYNGVTDTNGPGHRVSVLLGKGGRHLPALRHLMPVGNGPDAVAVAAISTGKSASSPPTPATTRPATPTAPARCRCCWGKRRRHLPTGRQLRRGPQSGFRGGGAIHPRRQPRRSVHRQPGSEHGVGAAGPMARAPSDDLQRRARAARGSLPTSVAVGDFNGDGQALDVTTKLERQHGCRCFRAMAMALSSPRAPR